MAHVVPVAGGSQFIATETTYFYVYVADVTRSYDWGVPGGTRSCAS